MIVWTMDVQRWIMENMYTNGLELYFCIELR
jgi:hypothetical protein